MKTINFLKTALLTIALFVCGNVGAETYNYEFTQTVWKANGTATLNAINWDLQTDAGYFGYDANKGQQLGSGNKPSTYVTLSTSDIMGDISSITVYTSGASSINATFSATIGGQQFGEAQNITATSTAYTFTGNGNGEIILRWDNNSSKAIYIKSIEIVYSTSAIAVLPPVFSVPTGKYTEAQSVTISCETAEASIYYTTDGTEPSEQSTPYNGAINITSTKTLKAIAIKDGEKSAVATATYTILTATPATIADFLATEESADVYYELTGTISNIANTIYGNFDLTDATGTVYVYGLTSTFQTSNDKSFASLNLTEGDLITIRGTRASYGGNAQVGGAYFVSKTELPRLEKPTAIAATEITSTGFTANWNTVANATSYEVNVWTEETIEFGIANSSFENGLDNWTAEAEYAISSEQAHTGSQSLGFTATGTRDLRQTINNVTPGETITVTYWYYLESLADEKGLRLWSTWEGSEDGTLKIEEYSNTTGAWTEVTATTTVPAGATALNFEIRVYNGAKGYIDDITVTQTNASGTTVQTPIVGSPFIVTGSTNTAIINLAEETTYYYNVVAKADGYTASEASNTVEVKTLGEPTYAITGEGVTFDEATGYTLELGEVVLNDVAKEFTLTASNYNSSISLSSTRGLWKLAETAATGDLYTFTPDENGSINANLTVSFKTTEEMMGTTIEDLINYGMIAYGRPQTEQWAIIIDGEIDNYLYISFTPTEEGPVTGICDQPEMEGISFNGQEIINSLNLDVAVYNAIGQMVVRSNENINMSSYPAGVYVIKAANGESMKIVK